MTKLQEIRIQLWLERFHYMVNHGNDITRSTESADQHLKDFDSRFPEPTANPIPPNEKHVMLNGGKWISILEAETALESASEIILKARDALVCGQIREPAIQWLRRYYPTED